MVSSRLIHSVWLARRPRHLVRYPRLLLIEDIQWEIFRTHTAAAAWFALFQFQSRYNPWSYVTWMA